MPRAVDPNDRFYVVLASDAATALERQPRFVYHYLTAREHRRLGQLNEKLLEAVTIDQVVDETFEAVKMGLVDWEHMTDRNGQPVPFNLDELEDLVGLIEAQELVNLMSQQNPRLVSRDDKKKHDSPSACATAKSATSADPENASIAPAPPNPSP